MNARPQPIYRMMREHSPIVATDDGVMLIRHDDVMYALRHPEIFSSDMDAIALGNVRPLIPLQIDPPDHVKFRKILDPLFAPKRGRASLEDEVRDAHEPADRRLHRPRPGRAQRASSRSRCPAPSSSRSWVCPRTTSRPFLTLQGQHHPARGDDRRPRPATRSVRDGRRDVRVLRQSHRVAPSRTPRRPRHPVRRKPRSTATASPTRTSSTSASCSSSRGSTPSPPR